MPCSPSAVAFRLRAVDTSVKDLLIQDVCIQLRP